MHMKSVSLLRLIVNSCIAEFDLFKFICITLIFVSLSRVSVDLDTSVALLSLGSTMYTCLERKYAAGSEALEPPLLETVVGF